MKLLNRLFNYEDTPVHVGRALVSERPMWLVSCVLSRQEVFGQVSSEASYEVQASNEEKARESVRSYLMQSQPEYTIESIQASRRSRY